MSYLWLLKADIPGAELLPNTFWAARAQNPAIWNSWITYSQQEPSLSLDGMEKAVSTRFVSVTFASAQAHTLLFTGPQIMVPGSWYPACGQQCRVTLLLTMNNGKVKPCSDRQSRVWCHCQWLLAQLSCSQGQPGSMVVALIFCILAINTAPQIVRDTWSCAALHGCAQLDKTHSFILPRWQMQKVKEKSLETIPHIYSFVLHHVSTHVKNHRNLNKCNLLFTSDCFPWILVTNPSSLEAPLNVSNSTQLSTNGFRTSFPSPPSNAGFIPYYYAFLGSGMSHV